MEDISYRWQPIRDYLLPHAQLAVPGLSALAQVWDEQRSRLENQEAYTRFERRLKREWAIETGLIEGLYTLDRGITQLLLERGIQAALIPREQAANPEWVAATMTDHESAVNGLFDFVKRMRTLSTSYIKELHALMTRHQEKVVGVDSLHRRTSVPLRRGAYKSLPNNPSRNGGATHEYCPPEHVESEMDCLIKLHNMHHDVAPEVEAAWIHHRFTQIHPFQDGNGRIARALATLVFIRAGWFPLVVRDRDRLKYLEALETADRGNLKPLVEYFARMQRNEFVRALSIVEDVRQELHVSESILAVRRLLQKRRDSLIEEWEAAKSITATLQSQAQHRLSEVAEELERQMAGVLQHGRFFADGAAEGSHRDHYYRYQIIQAAISLEYFANTTPYRAWVRLVLQNTNRTVMLVAFHGIGHDFRGVLACSASLFQRVETDDGEREIGPVELLSDSVFLINYKETIDEAEARFHGWLEGAIVQCLKLWQETAL